MPVSSFANAMQSAIFLARQFEYEMDFHMADPVFGPALVKLIGSAMNIGAAAINYYTESVVTERIQAQNARDEELRDQDHEQRRIDRQIQSKERDNDRQTISELGETIIDRIDGGREKDRKIVFDMIESSRNSIEESIELSEKSILNSIEVSKYKDLVAEFRARIKNLEFLLDKDFNSESVRYRMLMQAVHPLEVQLDVCKIRLSDFGEKRALDFFSIVGSSVIISTYKYFGEEREELVRDLEEKMKEIQIMILNEYASSALESGQLIPWHEVPELLKFENFSRIEDLYEKQILHSETKKNTKEQKPLYDRISDFTESQLKSYIGPNDLSKQEIQRAISAETKNRGREVIISILTKELAARGS